MKNRSTAKIALAAMVAALAQTVPALAQYPGHEQTPPANTQPADPSCLQPVPQRGGPPASGPPPITLIGKGRQELARGDVEAAIGSFSQYVRLRPADASGHFWLGYALDQSGSAKQALFAYSKSIDAAAREGMDSAELRVNAGNLLLRSHILDDAIFNYRRAIEIDPNIALAHFHLGRALVEKGQYKEAFESLNRATQLGLREPSLTLYRGLALKGMGKQEDARVQLKLFRDSLPASAQGLKADVERALEGSPDERGAAEGVRD